jgi:L-ascorbate metabolism protein UlaG (beta-lactamase superfamily)
MLTVSDNIKIFWIGHASFRIETEGKNIYLDPWKVTKGTADIILITHSHFDHLSLDDIKKVRTDKTVIVATRDSSSKLKGDVRIVKPGDSIEIDGIKVEAIPSYNIGKSFHPKANGWVGYLLSTSGKRIYHAGDTDAISEMKKLSVDVALLPVGGAYTMTAEEAAKIANEFKPAVVVPMHWGDIVGSKSDAERFRELFNGNTEILEREG